MHDDLRQHRAQMLLWFCWSATAGVAAAAWRPIWFDGLALFAVLWLCLIATLILWPRPWAAVFLLAAGLALGYWRYQAVNQVTSQDLRFYLNQDIQAIGRVAAEPELSNNSWRLTIAIDDLADRRPVRGRLITYSPVSKHYAYGDQVAVACWLEAPQSPEFDAARYWQRFKVAGFCQDAELTLLAEHQGNWFYQQIVDFRQTAARLINAGLPYEEASLGGAMVLGVGNKLNPELKTAFSRSGLTHLVAISGLNVSLLVMLLLNGSLALGLKRQYSLWLSLAAVGVYVVLVGAPASAVRAGIMGVLLLLAAWLGRWHKLINALAAAAAVTLLANPFLLRDDIGWQLSFLAILSIIYLYPLLRLVLRSAHDFFDLLLSGLALTLAAQIGTWPIIALSFKQLSVIAPLANVLAVWTTPFILMAIFGALFLSWLQPWLWWWSPAWLVLKYLISVTYLTAQIPWAAITVPAPGAWQIIGYYLVLSLAAAIGFILMKKKKPTALSSDKDNFLW